MQTLREKISFVLTGLAYLVTNIGVNPSTGSIISGTLKALLVTAPYYIGFTFVLVAIIRHMHDGKRPAWHMIARIYFTIGILSGLFWSLYQYGDRAHEEQLKLEREKQVSVSLSYRGDNQKMPLYWA